MKSMFKLFLLLIFSLQILHAEDMNHSVMGSTVDDVLKDKPSIDEEKNKYENLEKIPNKFNFIKKPSDATKISTEKSELKSKGYSPPTNLEYQKEYVKLDKEKLGEKIRRNSLGDFSFSYMKDTFRFQDNFNNVTGSYQNYIEKVINGSGSSHRIGFLKFGASRFLYQADLFKVYWHTGLGISYSQGQGYFDNGVMSQTLFRLWQFPVDLSLGIDIPLYHWFSITGEIGPSVDILLQNRNDFTDNEKGKNKFQVSHGDYFAFAFRVSLTGLSQNFQYDMFTSSQISNMYLSLEWRTHSYRNFLDDIQISGNSFGLGFTFEYL